MPQTFAIDSFLGDASTDFNMIPEKERGAILENACYIIEEKLADMDYLKRFTWNGRQAFYNDEPLSGYGHSGEHMKDSFYVSLSAGGNQFIVGNPKVVYGKSGDGINLFDDLLWHPFGRYRVPLNQFTVSKELENYHLRTKQMRKQFYKVGGPLTRLQSGEHLMSFYYRYMGRNYYNVIERRGMDDSLHSKFVDYIHTAIQESLREAIDRYLGERTTEMMGGNT